MSFNQFNLDPRLLASVDRAGFVNPTPIQTRAIPVVLSGHDLIGTAQTGTGKTAAFVLPILQRLIPAPRRRAQALIITPTRELAEQIHDTIQTLSRGLRIGSATLYGGVSAVPQRDALRNGVEILVACPGRLLDHLQQGHARLEALTFLVLDEADRMFDMGFLPDIQKILKYIPKKRQTLLFSATFPSEIRDLAAQTLTHPQYLTLGLNRPVHTVAHALFPVPRHLKTKLILSLLKRTQTGSVLIFTRTRHRAQGLARKIQNSGFKVTSLHSDRTQNQRQAALNGFKNGIFQIMVATDIAARGLDVEKVSHVINFDMPDTPDAYIHRIGRTGRAENRGDAFTLTTPDDNDMVLVLEKIMGKPLRREMLPEFDYREPAPAPHARITRPERRAVSVR
ncbi:MAG TPA: DEAD/DEAH box helicase [bacterium]|nr:DEAD/DEAH box helicase [bacterium]